MMKDISRLFAIVVIAVMFILTVRMMILAGRSEEAINFDEEITGLLPEDSMDGGMDAAAGTKTGYNSLRRWGIVRGGPNRQPTPDPGTPELLSRYNSLYVGDIQEKIIYLTFDEGYENGYTGKILDVLYENQVNAIFFITGPYLEKEEELVRRMVEEGHAVGNHTISHKSLPTLSDEEIERETTGLDRRFYEKFGKNMVFLRPPKGEYSERTLQITSELGYVNVFWSFAYDDWNTKNQRGWEYAFKKVTGNLHNGAILLLHAVSSDNAEALDAIIKEARRQGYEFGDVFDLEDLARRGNP
ncbi:MAG TPA: polysaccharide deacetylase family protein [Thermoclostridium caenicola]|nr:polysaccharide deacetylase family protein [Thermoclostridium caenicola]HOK43873.1 polysaccharide deacetylase family protein [Thermoclostridium caenicola]HOL85318.1 polysaccharide deacetylase family protein [Thermoclostridium caenicola]HPO77154.1 polysaccharide deacetylase family protein [Thermoclostridium caenicola]